MDQQDIREYNGQRYSLGEGAAIIKELDDRTRYDQPGYNSVAEIGSKVKTLVENPVAGPQGPPGADGGEEGVVWSRTLADANAITPKDINKAYAVDSDPDESKRGYYVWNGTNLIKNRPLENFTYFNLYDKTNNSPGSGYLRYTVGGAAELQTQDGLEFGVSGYIDVVGDAIYTLQGRKSEIAVGTDAKSVVFYNASNQVLRPYDLDGNEYPDFSIPTLNGSFKAPPTAVQMRFNTKFYSLPEVIDDIIIVEGGVNLPYIPFGTKGIVKTVIVPADVPEGYIMVKKGDSFVGLNPDEISASNDLPTNDLGYPIYGPIAGAVANFQTFQFEEVNQIPNTGKHLLFYNGNLVFVNEGVITNLV